MVILVILLIYLTYFQVVVKLKNYEKSYTLSLQFCKIVEYLKNHPKSTQQETADITLWLYVISQ
jgi:hypothetical protein